MATDDRVRLAYRWAQLLPSDEPSRELVAAVSGADVRYFHRQCRWIGKRQGLADVVMGRARLQEGRRQLSRIVEERRRRHAGIAWRHRQRLEQYAAGFPLVGVSELMKVRNGTRGYRDAPVVHGYELPLP